MNNENNRHFALRRNCLKAMLAAPLAGGIVNCALAYPKSNVKLELVATSPEHLWNGVTLTANGRMFASMPRWPGFEQTPALVEVMKDGSLVPYPGGAWNAWKPGDSSRDSFVGVNAVNCFDGVTIWAVDQGTVPNSDAFMPGAGKFFQIDTRTNKIVRKYSFGEDVLPPGAAFNDIRIYGRYAYLTDSGAGALVAVDLQNGKGLRRLAGHYSTCMQRPGIARDNVPMMHPDGKPHTVHADQLEVSPDGDWLYYQTAEGPLYRVPTRALRDPSISEAEVQKSVEYVYDTPTLGGTAIDDKGNLFLAEASRPCISVLTPDGDVRVLIEDENLWGGDGLFITADRYLYVPISQSVNLQLVRGPGGKSLITYPFKIWRFKLPEIYGGPTDHRV
jgi:hypothetical protein